MMRGKFVASIAVFSVVAAGMVPAPLATAYARTPTSVGFCRTPSALPKLPAESARHPPPLLAPPPPSSPPPPPTVRAMDSSSATVVVTGSSTAEREAGAAIGGDRGETTSVERPHSPYPPYPPAPQPQPQSGILTAGEHDDLLNPELYAAYVNRSDLGQKIRALPRVDTMRMLTVKVNDRSGQPVPFADVIVTCTDGNSITLATQADGSTAFFPGLDRLSERVTIAARKSGRVIADTRSVLVSDAPGSQIVGLTAKSRAAPIKKLDLMLVIDTTGSMGDEIRYLQSELQAIMAALAFRHRDVDMRIGFIFYRDTGDEYVTRTVGFDSDIGRAQAALAQQSANGGGDYPEAMDEALIRAVGQDWRPDAVKSLLLVADAPPHDAQFGQTWAAAEVARAKRIHITPIAASGVADKAEYAMRAMAAATQSRYLFLTDDSGVGNSHAPPAIDCYLVTRLDALVRRVIDSQLSGRRIEPERQEIIRRVGQYDAGKCILPADFTWQS